MSFRRRGRGSYLAGFQVPLRPVSSSKTTKMTTESSVLPQPQTDRRLHGDVGL
jgi:hypothetical protein